MCGNRGLLLGSENQTYRVLAPKNLRVLYDRLVLPILKPTYFNGNATANGQQPHITDLDYSKKLNDRHQFERTLNTYQSINRFFMAFIDHVRRWRNILNVDLITILVLSFSPSKTWTTL